MCINYGYMYLKVTEAKESRNATNIAADGEPRIAGAEGRTEVEGQVTPAAAVDTRTRRQIRQAFRRFEVAVSLQRKLRNRRPHSVFATSRCVKG